MSEEMIKEDSMTVNNVFMLFNQEDRSTAEKIVLGTLMVNQMRMSLYPLIIKQVQLRSMMILGFESLKGFRASFVASESAQEVTVAVDETNNVRVVTYPKEMAIPKSPDDDAITDAFCAVYLGRALKPKENKGSVRKIREAMERDIVSWTEKLNSETLPTADDEELSDYVWAFVDIIGMIVDTLPGADSDEIDIEFFSDERLYDILHEQLTDDKIYRSSSPLFCAIGFALTKYIWGSDIADQIYLDTGMAMTPDNLRQDPMASYAASLMNTLKIMAV